MNYTNIVVPNHLAIIIDGNRRWAKNKGFDLSSGHRKGFEQLEEIVKYAVFRDIKYISLFVFSTENFKRDKIEIDYLMKLFSDNFRQLATRLNKEDVKATFSGRKNLLSEKILDSMEYMESLTKNNTKAVVNFCLNYGGHAEIIDACIQINKDIVNKKINIEDINEEMFEDYLYNVLPPIDLLIRTSGEQRLSNFMLWQLAYSELYFIEKNFPDFRTDDFDAAIVAYNCRDRRFGANSKKSFLPPNPL